MSTAAISVSGLSKRYRLGTVRAPYGRLTEALADRIGATLSRRPRAGLVNDQYVWALRDVSFEVPSGEAIGIIGANGAGKTTLLKILSRITEPTEGRATVRGRVGALLEVAAGFHQELTGRENVLLHGAILGMRRSEIRSRFDEIVAFAGVERFIDTPVKRYSSGMYLRLAFSVAAHLEPDVLIVDEVLAVGDAAFQRKCLGRMEDVAGSGRTVLFVSHNMGAIRSLCQRALLLEGGRIVFDGAAGDAVAAYLARVADLEAGGEVTWHAHDPTRPSTDDIALDRIALIGPAGRPNGVHQADRPIRIEIDHEVLRPVSGGRFVLALMTQEGEVAFKTTDHKRRPDVERQGRYRSTATIPAGLLNRRNYVVVLSFELPGIRMVLHPTNLLTFTVAGLGNQGSDFTESWDGVVCPVIDWGLQALGNHEAAHPDGGEPSTREAQRPSPANPPRLDGS
jgi:lipopolysaccharide transport system ATP-binding protein